MDINEIKIGDWFEFSEGRGQISLIYGDTVTIGTYQPDIAELKPIPLTKEILEKNGWEVGSLRLPLVDGRTNAEMLQFARKSFVGLLFDRTEKYFSYDFENHRFSIRYVHELQHLLWTLGLDDNLKV